MALKQTIEKRTGKRDVLSTGGAGEDFTAQVIGQEDYQYDWVTGWTSEETGMFYELAPAGFEAFANQTDLNGKQAINGAYYQQREQVVKQQDWDEQLKRETAQIQAQQAQERATWQAQMAAQQEEFSRQQTELKRAADLQAQQFETEKQQKEAARIAAEKAKQDKLASEAKISGETLLGDMLRVSGVKENDLVASEDKKTLNVEDKAQLFSSGQQDETEQVKAKQTFLEKILSSGVTGAPKQ